MERQRHFPLSKWPVLFCVLTVAFLVVSCTSPETETGGTTTFLGTPSTSISTQTSVQQTLLSDNEIEQKIFPAVAHVIGSSDKANGVMVDSRGYMLTNNHAIADDDSVTVELPDKEPVMAQVVYRDTDVDIAILQCPGADYEYVPLGSGQQAQISHDVAVLWYQPNWGPGASPLISRGVIYEFITLQDLEYIAADATTNWYSRGGPMINSSGEIIGIMSRGIADTEGVNLAIDISSILPDIEAALQQLIISYSQGE
jgi:S1-C subfamily serine protease